MENKTINSLESLIWLLYIPIYFVFSYAVYFVTRDLIGWRNYLPYLSGSIAVVVIAIFLFIGYLKFVPQSVFSKDASLKRKETIFLIFLASFLLVVIYFIIEIIFYPTNIKGYFSVFSYYKLYSPNLNAIFQPHYYTKFAKFELELMLILAPIFEEITYRRVIYDSIKRQSHSFIVAALISTICFAVPHFNQNENAIYNAHHLVCVFCVGLVLSYCYEKTKRILPCMIVHCLANARIAFLRQLQVRYDWLFPLFLFLISLSIIGYVFVRYLLKLYKKHAASLETTKLLEMSSHISHASSSNNRLQDLKTKGILGLVFFSCLFESLIVMQTIIMIFRLSVDYKIVWYASIQLAFFVVAVLYVRDCHVSLSDVLVKKSVNLNWSLIVKFLCATFVLCFVFFYLPNVSRFSSVISFFKNNNAVLDLSIFNFSDSSPIAFIIFIFIAPIIEQMIFKFGVHHFTKSKSRIIPIAMFVSFVVFGLLYTLRLGFTLTELTVIFCVKLFLLYVHEKSESMLTCVVLQLFITVILFLNRYLFFVYSAPVFFALASVSVVVLGFTLIDFLRRKKLDTEHGVDEVVALDVGMTCEKRAERAIEGSVGETCKLDE